LSAFNAEVSDEPDLFYKRALSRRDDHLRVEACNAIERRLRFADEQTKNVLNAPVLDAQVDGSGLAVLAGLTCDFAIGEDAGLQEGGGDAFELTSPLVPSMKA
jgi:hypothetical protein